MVPQSSVCLLPTEHDRRQNRIEHLFQPANDIFGQHADHQASMLLQLEVLAAI